MLFRVIILILIHAAGDFLLQGSGLSHLKSKKSIYLFVHVGIYTALLIILSPLFLGLSYIQGLTFGLLNGFAHLIVDFITIKLKNKFWEKNEAAYIAVISFDHIIHLLILIGSFILMYPDIFLSTMHLD
jgi:hypothetical protein